MGLPQSFTVTAGALYAGLHTSTIYRWIATGFLPARRRVRGRGYVILDTDIDACKATARGGASLGKRTPKRPYYLRALAKQRDKYRQTVAQYKPSRKRHQGA